MKVALIATHQLSVGSVVPLLDCLGVLALAASVQRHCRHVRCEVMDLVDFGEMGRKPYDRQIELIADRVAASQADVLGLSTMSNNLIIALDVCRKAKQRNPALHTVLGGPGVSFCAAEVVRTFSHADTVIRGEADKAFPDFLNAFRQGSREPPIPGVVRRVDGQVLDCGWPEPIANLDQLPIPLYDARFEYTSPSNVPEKHNSVSLEVGRGCPFCCTFCCTSRFFKRRFRVKSVERVLEEISVIQSCFGDKKVIFNHDLLTFDHSYVCQLSRALQAHTPRVNWGCSARLDSVTPDLLAEMRKAGCERIFLGIEVATPKMQKSIRKNLDLTHLDETLNALVSLDFGFTLSFIVGFPGEESSDIEALVLSVLRSKSRHWEKVRIQIHALAPEPGSDLLRRFQDQLAYDDYGSPGTSDVPASWEGQRNVIREHPEIFPTYFHIASTTTPREQVLKLTYLAGLIELKMTFSLQLAFSVLGRALSSGLIEKMSEIELPPPDPYPGRQHVRLMDSVRRVVRGIGRDAPSFLSKFEAMAQYEMAVAAVMEDCPKLLLKAIEVDYDPEELIGWISSRCQGTLERGRRYYIVFRNGDDERPKCARVPKALVDLLNA